MFAIDIVLRNKNENYLEIHVCCTTFGKQIKFI